PARRWPRRSENRGAGCGASCRDRDTRCSPWQKTCSFRGDATLPTMCIGVNGRISASGGLPACCPQKEAFIVVRPASSRIANMLRPWLRWCAAALFVGFTLQAPPLSAQQTLPGRETTADSVARYALSDKMPVDPEALVGTLPNGLRYYVRANPKPAKRAELRLVVKAGSVL